MGIEDQSHAAADHAKWVTQGVRIQPIPNMHSLRTTRLSELKFVPD
jgi:hypothetical protein